MKKMLIILAITIALARVFAWGFGRFINGKPVDKTQHETYFACHETNAKGNDLVFTRYAF